jgi:hypothetical protein
LAEEKGKEMGEEGTYQLEGCILENGNQVYLGRMPDGRYMAQFINNTEDPPRKTELVLSDGAMMALANLYMGGAKI